MMESGDKTDEAAKRSFSSKLGFFKSMNQSQQSTQTMREENVRGQPKFKQASMVATASQVTSALTQVLETERSTSPQRNSTGSPTKEPTIQGEESPPASETMSPETNIRSVSPQRNRTASPTKEPTIQEEESSPASETTSPETDKRSVSPQRNSTASPTKEPIIQGEESPPASETTQPETDRSGFSSNDMEVFQQPMCLVSTDEENKLNLEMETAEQISKIDWPIVVVSVVGLYRTGKSYLMNRLAESSHGFALGSTIESKTKGIWVWCKIHPKKSNTVLVLLDTEGLGDVEKGDQNHDNKIFILATLLCNCLVYNIKGAFDQDAISKLTFVTEMAKNIRFSGDKSRLNLVLPDFVLCLRDFSLELSYEGKEISEDGYLEKCLEERENKDKAFNKPRKCIRKYFPVRRCFTFPVPGDRSVLKNMETLQLDDLDSEFKAATSRFVSHVYNFAPKTLITSKPITGHMFTVLADKYVTAIRAGFIPDVDDAFSAAAKLENDRVENIVLMMFEDRMGTLTPPVPIKNLEALYTEAQQNALAYQRENAVHDNLRQYETQAQIKMDNQWKKLKGENKDKIRQMCDVKLQELRRASVTKKNEDGGYKIAGGHKIFLRDMTNLKEEFTSSLRDFEEHEILWTWLGFMAEMKEEENQIIEADDAMSYKEKEEEIKRNEENMKNVIQKQEENIKQALEEQRKTMNEHNEKIIKERDEKFKKELSAMKDLVTLKLGKGAAEWELSEFKRKQEEKKQKWFLSRIADAIWNE